MPNQDNITGTQKTCWWEPTGRVHCPPICGRGSRSSYRQRLSATMRSRDPFRIKPETNCRTASNRRRRGDRENGYY